MLLTCPDCDTSYQIDSESLPASGRKVKCAKCGHRWTAEPAIEEPVPEPDPFDAIDVTDFDVDGEDMPIVEGVLDVFSEGPPEDGGEGGAQLVDDDGWDQTVWSGNPTWDPDLPEKGSRLTRARRQGPKSSRSVLQPVLIGAAIALIVAGLHYREDVVRTLPSTAGLFAAVGLPVNLRGLDFAELQYRHVIENGVPVLTVNGAVANVTDAPVFVPNLNFTLRGDRRQNVYQWTITPSETMLEAGGRLEFSTRLAAPPSAAHDLVVRFVDPAPAEAG